MNVVGYQDCFLSDVDDVVADLLGLDDGGFCEFMGRTYGVELDRDLITNHGDMGSSPGLADAQEKMLTWFPRPPEAHGYTTEEGIGAAFTTFMQNPHVYSDWIHPVPGAIDAINEIRNSHRVIFVTAMMDRARAHFKDKMQWVEHYFPGCKIMTVPSSLKHLVRGRYAVDDKWDTCQRWHVSGVHSFPFRRPWTAAPVGARTYDWQAIKQVVTEGSSDV